MKIISENNPNCVSLACETLKNGGLIAFATDTIYGIACDASNSQAVQNLYRLKNRDSKKPIAIFVKDIAMAKEIFVFDERSEKLAKKFLPGKLTLVLETKKNESSALSEFLNQKIDSEESSDFLGFRIVDHEFVQNLMIAFDGVLAVSSANISTQKPALNAKEVEKYFKNTDLNLIIDGETAKEQKSSTVVKVKNKEIEVLRHGAIDKESLKVALLS